MKRYFWLLCIFLILLAVPASAATPSFLILDQLQNRVAVIGSDLKLLSSFKAGTCPSALAPTPDHNGYWLMCRGAKDLLGKVKEPGELLYLDSDLKPTTQKIIFSGRIVQDFYLKTRNLWVLITQNGSSAQTPATVWIADLKTGSNNHFNIGSVPTAYQFNTNTDRSVFAFTTLGASTKKVLPQLCLINLNSLQIQSFPVAANPGGIYFINDRQIMVACGGYRDSFKYSSEIPVEHFEKSVNASLDWIDISNGKAQVTTLGYSPLVVIQDRNNPDTFYAASSDTVYDKPARGILRKVTAAAVRSEVPFAAEATKLIQTKPGSIALLGKEEFYLFNPDCTQVMANRSYTLPIEQLLLNSEETMGYLSVTNSQNVDVIDTVFGKSIQKIKISSSIFGGPLNLSSLIPHGLPAVSGMLSPTSDLPDYSTNNNRIIMTPDNKSLYSLASNGEVSGFDTEKGNQISSTKFSAGKPYGIHFMPNNQFIAVAADTYWYLLDPGLQKPKLSLPLFSGDFQTSNGYYSPEGNLLVIPSNGYYYLVDCQSCKLIGKLRNNIQKGAIAWIP
jgi:hypothetical protein